jgi:pSer/pThr/pTyr-binding forkhead associated (FHA) protein
MSFAEKKSYTIGRLHVDIPIEMDNSISRKNTIIEMKKNKIYIDDIGSKHGTYIRIEPPIVVKDK